MTLCEQFISLRRLTTQVAQITYIPQIYSTTKNTKRTKS